MPIGATRDLIMVDLPPGTGDVQLSMIQKHKPAGAVIVSTPQDLALIDATRAIDLFVAAGVPIIGLVENMSGYACPHCGETSDPFGRGGAQIGAQDMRLPVSRPNSAGDGDPRGERRGNAGASRRVRGYRGRIGPLAGD